MSLIVRIKPRAQRQIEKAAKWWSEHRPAAPGAVSRDVGSAVALLAEQPQLGTLVWQKTPPIRRLYLSRIGYFLYYRQRARHLEVIAFWHANRESEPSL